MKKQFVLAAALSAVAFAAQAGVTGGLAANQSPTSFIALSSANVSGGSLYPDTTSPLPDAAIPYNATPVKQTIGTWLAAGPGNTNNGGSDATVSFGAAATGFVSFLWGSPDPFNMLTVKTSDGLSTAFAGNAGLNGTLVTGDQDYASYVGFQADAGVTITSLVFSSSQNAFEASNFSVTAPVPEPETYALMLAGLGVVGFMARRRKSV